MKTQSTVVLLVLAALLACGSLLAAPADPASCGPSAVQGSARGVCSSAPAVCGPAEQGQPVLSADQLFAATSGRSGSCNCNAGICCGCSPCPPSGMGFCCSLDLGGGLCGAVQACPCFLC